MTVYFIILIVMTFIGSAASLFLKRASGTENLLGMIKNKNLYLGGGLYFISALLNIYILRFLDYSVVLPLTSLTYVWTMFLSKIFLKEKISAKKKIGIAAILIGACLVSI